MSTLKRILFTAMLLASSFVQANIEVTDIAGRSIVLEEPVERFVISEGRYISTLALLQPENPIKGLLGMISPLSWTNPSMQAQLIEQFPEASDIALFGSKDESSVSVEKIIDLNPQIAIFGVQDHGPGTRAEELLAQLESAGIQVVFIDFRMDPLHHTLPSIELLGHVFGRESEAKAYVEYYQNKIKHIREVAQTLEKQPTVFVQAHPGRMPCCRGMADGMLGPFVGLVGGKNIADAVAPGPTSAHTAEFMLVEDPDVWIGTASGTAAEALADKDPVAAGPGVSIDMAKKNLNHYLSDKSFTPLSAVKEGRAHIVWHNLYNSPFNIIAVEAFAHWIHPEAFAHLDPNGTAEEIYDRFLPFEPDGVYTATADKP